VKIRPVLLCLAAAACSCAPVRPRRAPAPKALDAQARKQAAQEYYEAVDAYMKEDYARARALIASILAADPGNADALALRRRIQAVQKLSTP
jgi:phage tail protein X